MIEYGRFSLVSHLLKYGTLVSSLLFCLGGVLNAAPFEALKQVSKPDFELIDLDGNIQKLSKFEGKVVLINFWASWCSPCVTELPELAQIQKQMEGRPFVIMAINVGEGRRRVTQFAKVMGLELSVLLDPTRSVFDNWGEQILPSSLLLDAQGRVRYRALGNPGWFDLETEDILQALVEQAEGC